MVHGVQCPLTEQSSDRTFRLYNEDHIALGLNVPISSPTNLCIIWPTHCSRTIASLASATAWLSEKSTPSNVGGTLGFLAKKSSDSGVGILADREVRERIARV